MKSYDGCLAKVKLVPCSSLFLLISGHPEFFRFSFGNFFQIYMSYLGGDGPICLPHLSQKALRLILGSVLVHQEIALLAATKTKWQQACFTKSSILPFGVGRCFLLLQQPLTVLYQALRDGVAGCSEH